MTNFKIEKNVPFVARKKWNGEGLFAVLRDMSVGDSVFCEGFTQSRASGSAAYAQKKIADSKFSCRTVEGGVRIWRVQ